jgi:hypothetical protein
MQLTVIFGAALAFVAAWGWTRPCGRPEQLARQRQALALFAPVLIAAALSGATTGLARRERAGSGAGYASPTLSWLGKRTALAGVFVVAAWASTPLPLAPGWLWVAPLALLAGSFIYIGNLPARL